MKDQEAKEKFIAQYWGCKVVHDRAFEFNELIEVSQATFNSKALPYEELHLTSLSNISDEDAINVVMLAHSTSFLNEESSWKVEYDEEFEFKTVSSKKSYHSFDIDTTNGKISMYDGDNQSNTQLDHYSAVDYLRSKGYALSYYCPIEGKIITVEEQITRGWIKFKEESNG